MRNGKLLHVHRTKGKQKFYVLLFAIPSMVFVSGLAVAGRQQTQRAAVQAGGGATLKVEEDKSVRIGEIEIVVGVADNEMERRRGLSGIGQLADNQGLLFVFEGEETQPPFWMKDMKIAIDIVWIKNGEVVQIDGDVTPPVPGTPEQDLKLYFSDQPVEYVLEVAGGFCERAGIAVGDKVEIGI